MLPEPALQVWGKRRKTGSGFFSASQDTKKNGRLSPPAQLFAESENL